MSLIEKKNWVKSDYSDVAGRLVAPAVSTCIFLYGSWNCSVAIRLVGMVGPEGEHSSWKALKRGKWIFLTLDSHQILPEMGKYLMEMFQMILTVNRQYPSVSQV